MRREPRGRKSALIGQTSECRSGCSTTYLISFRSETTLGWVTADRAVVDGPARLSEMPPAAAHLAISAQDRHRSGPCAALGRDALSCRVSAVSDPTLQLRTSQPAIAGMGISNATAGSGFSGDQADRQKPRPGQRAQCLGDMPWSCRATAFKPDAANLVMPVRKSTSRPTVLRKPCLIL